VTVGSVVKPFPLNKVKQSGSLAMTVNSAVKNLMDLPLVRVIQLDWWQGVYGSVGNLTRTSGLQQQHVEDRDAQQS